MKSVLPAIQEAFEQLVDNECRQGILNRIQRADPYRDKRFAPVMAGWFRYHGVAPEEHAEDVVRFKELRRRLKALRVPATNRERTAHVKELLSRKPHDFTPHYSLLQDWNRVASNILDPDRDLSDEGLPVEMRHDGYTMYRIETIEHCQVPLVRNSMGWCVTKRYFGKYGEPPYYAIVRDHDKKPFCMIVPACFDEDPDQAVRNSDNTDRISSADLKLIRPLAQRALPFDLYEHPYINGIHDVRPKKLSMSKWNMLETLKDYAIEPGDWPEGEEHISRCDVMSYWYAIHVIKGPWRQGERAIISSRHSHLAYDYAMSIIKGPWPDGEPAISQNAEHAYYYAKYIIKAPFPLGERAIAKDARLAFDYAYNILKGPFTLGERAISRDARYAYEYARHILNAPWPIAEPTIRQNAEYSVRYAHYLIKGPWPEAEDAISESAEWAYKYANHIINGRWRDGERSISKSAEWACRYAIDVIKGPWALGKKAIMGAGVFRNEKWAEMYEEFCAKQGK